MTTSDTIRDSRRIIDQIKPLLAGHSPDVQGLVLLELAALWLAGHAPALRDEVFAIHIEALRDLVPLSDHELFGDAGHPATWGSA